MKIYTLEDKEIEKMLDRYIDYVTNPKSKDRKNPICYNPFRFDEFEARKENEDTERGLAYDYSAKAIGESDMITPVKVWTLKKPNRDKLRPHFISLMHQLYMRYIGTEGGYFRMNTEILQEQYKYYNHMLYILCRTGIFSSHGVYINDIYTEVYTISRPEKFKYIETENVAVIKDIDKLKAIFDRIHARNIKEAENRTSSSFVEQYNKNIRRYKIAKLEEVKAFMTSHEFDTTRSKLYHQHIINKIANREIKEIHKCDENGRFYHIASQTPKVIRKWTNINYTIDAKNSHPLLFNYLIINYYMNNNIDIKYDFKNSNNKIVFIISSFLYNNSLNNLHYFRKELCICLKNNNVENEVQNRLMKIPKDVWMYMYNTSHGKLWDDIVAMFPTLTRDEVKNESFKKIFYSYTKNITAKNDYGKAFQAIYPNVIKVIRFYKKKFNAECSAEGLLKERKVKEEIVTKDAIQLPHKLMQLESAIFTEILTRLFKKRDLHCIGIHDAIAVLNDKYPPEFVEGVMLDVYKEYGLLPTLDIEKNINTNNN